MCTCDIGESCRTALGNFIAFLCSCLALYGLCLVGVGLYLKFKMEKRTIMLENYDTGLLPQMLMYTGGAISFLHTLGAKFSSDIGCAETRSSLQESFLKVFLIFFALLGIASLAAGSMCIAHRSIVHTAAEKGLMAVMKRYKEDPDVRKVVHEIQSDFECCGSASFKDWFEISWISNDYLNLKHPNVISNLKDGDYYSDDVPFSCCRTNATRPCIFHKITKPKLHPAYTKLTINKKGCAAMFSEFYERFILFPSGLAGFSAFGVELLVVLLYRCLQTSIDSSNDEGDPEGDGKAYICKKGEEDDGAAAYAAQPGGQYNYNYNAIQNMLTSQGNWKWRQEENEFEKNPISKELCWSQKLIRVDIAAYENENEYTITRNESWPQKREEYIFKYEVDKNENAISCCETYETEQDDLEDEDDGDEEGAKGGGGGREKDYLYREANKILSSGGVNRARNRQPSTDRQGRSRQRSARGSGRRGPSQNIPQGGVGGRGRSISRDPGGRGSGRRTGGRPVRRATGIRRGTGGAPGRGRPDSRSVSREPSAGHNSRGGAVRRGAGGRGVRRGASGRTLRRGAGGRSVSRGSAGSRSSGGRSISRGPRGRPRKRGSDGMRRGATRRGAGGRPGSRSRSRGSSGHSRTAGRSGSRGPAGRGGGSRSRSRGPTGRGRGGGRSASRGPAGRGRGGRSGSRGPAGRGRGGRSGSRGPAGRGRASRSGSRGPSGHGRGGRSGSRGPANSKPAGPGIKPDRLPGAPGSGPVRSGSRSGSRGPRGRPRKRGSEGMRRGATRGAGGKSGRARGRR